MAAIRWYTRDGGKLVPMDSFSRPNRPPDFILSDAPQSPSELISRADIERVSRGLPADGLVINPTEDGNAEVWAG